MALFLFTKAILEDKPINIFNHGKMVRDFTYIDDIVESIIQLLSKPATPDDNFRTMSPNPRPVGRLIESSTLETRIPLP